MDYAAKLQHYGLPPLEGVTDLRYSTRLEGWYATAAGLTYFCDTRGQRRAWGLCLHGPIE